MAALVLDLKPAFFEDIKRLNIDPAAEPKPRSGKGCRHSWQIKISQPRLHGHRITDRQIDANIQRRAILHQAARLGGPILAKAARQLAFDIGAKLHSPGGQGLEGLGFFVA